MDVNLIDKRYAKGIKIAILNTAKNVNLINRNSICGWASYTLKGLNEVI